jgi:hypothetical protein
VFVGGYARTGSTLLDRLLGQVDGFASFGELRHVWERNFRGNQLCGCGRPFRECPFWDEVVRVAFGGWDGVDPAAVGRDKRRVDSVRNIPRNLTGGWTAGYRATLGRYLEAVGALYRAMASVSGARFLVDSTKDPQHLYVLRLAGIDVRVAHLVRDSRAVAFSWRRVRRPSRDHVAGSGHAAVPDRAERHGLERGEPGRGGEQAGGNAVRVHPVRGPRPRRPW